MTEKEIAEQLKQNIPQPQVTAAAPTDTNPSDTGYAGDLGDALDIYKMYDFFGLETQFRTPDNERKLQEVYRWSAQVIESTDYLEIIKLIMNIEQGMGGSMVGSRLERFHRWVKLEDQMNRLRHEQAII